MCGYTQDDTVEVLERHEANAGRDPFPALLRRAPLPKVSWLVLCCFFLHVAAHHYHAAT